MRITKLYSTYALLFVLITAFLAMQWTTAHIHLAEHHSHAGDHHQHQVEAHAHHLNVIDQHTAAIDFSQHESHTNVIEFGHEYNVSKNENKENPSSAVEAAIFPLLSAFLVISNKTAITANTRLSYFYHSSTHIRAPPQAS